MPLSNWLVLTFFLVLKDSLVLLSSDMRKSDMTWNFLIITRYVFAIVNALFLSLMPVVLEETFLSFHCFPDLLLEVQILSTY